MTETLEEQVEKHQIKPQVYEKIKLDKAFINYHSIIDKNLPYKFAYMDEWLLKSSKLLLNETNEKIKIRRIYKRGTIIKVDFGVGLGSEMSQVHFAIVLNNYDNPKNDILTVIPLTSKENKYNLDLNNLVIEKMINKLEDELDDMILERNNNSINDEVKIRKINALLLYYKKNLKKTYACCSLITTISKSRIFSPINEYDIIGRERCSDDVMDKIDKEIKNRFTHQFDK